MTTADLELTLAILRTVVALRSLPKARKIRRSEIDGLARRVRAELGQHRNEDGAKPTKHGDPT